MSCDLARRNVVQGQSERGLIATVDRDLRGDFRQTVGRPNKG